MMVLVSYDVDFTEKSGAARLRKVARVCSDYGVRVQNSVFEMIVDSTQLEEVKQKLLKIIDKNNDSVRFYHLGKNWGNKITTLGKLPKIDQEDTLIL